MLTKIPMLKVKANPLIKLVAKVNKIAQTINELKLLSLIDGQALVNPFSTETKKLFSCFNSSRIREKIKMLASTAIPIDNIKPAIPDKVKVTGINLNNVKTKTT